MRIAHRPSRWLAVAAAAGGLAAVAALLATANAPAATHSVSGRLAGHKCLVMTGSGDPSFVRNFNPYTATGLPSGTLVKGAFYEPLVITGEGGLKPVPWLAKRWAWSNHNRTLTLSLVRNAKWSDKKPLTSADVVYSLLAGKQNKAMDIIGVTRADSNIASIKAKGRYAVTIKLKKPDSQFIATTLNGQMIVPKHIWANVKNPATFTNSNPVGSGPFDVISRFTTQDYVFSKNPHYWKAGAPKIPCLEYVQASSNDAALALIKSGQVDWTHNFVPNVKKAYVSVDPKHYHAFYAKTAYPISLVFDDTQYPFSLPVLRKALSLAIDRKSISKLGEYGYAPPTDAVGLNGLFPQWVTNPAVQSQAKAMAAYNPSKAKSMLTAAGFKYSGGHLLDPKGNHVTINTHVISGWSDWVASNQILTKNLRAIGIASNVQLEPDWNSWYPNATATKNPTLLWQIASQASPYGFFNTNLSPNSYIPSGQDASASGDWEHFKDPAAQRYLNRWKTTLSTAKQHAAATALEKIWLKDLPVIPLFIGPRWSTYSTKYFHNFDSPKHFWGDPIFTTFPDNILSFTRIKPGGKAGG